MRRLLLRLLPGFLVVALFASFFTTSAFASTNSLHLNHATSTKTWQGCDPDNRDTFFPPYDYTVLASGNASGCSDPNFVAVEFPIHGQAFGEGTLATWTDTAITTSDTVVSCNIYAYFPYGGYSSDTKTRYDFWYGSHWLGWPGHDINQYSIAAGWQEIATNLPVYGSGAHVNVTVRDDGGEGWLALAAMEISCTYNYYVYA